jgi:hypothetical protein
MVGGSSRVAVVTPSPDAANHAVLRLHRNTIRARSHNASTRIEVVAGGSLSDLL